jgi:hypothetical protein
MRSISSDGLESPSPARLKKAVALSVSVFPYAESRNTFKALNFSVFGGCCRIDNIIYIIFIRTIIIRQLTIGD